MMNEPAKTLSGTMQGEEFSDGCHALGKQERGGRYRA